MTKKTGNSETTAEIINKQEKVITEEEENLTQDPTTINLEEKKEEDNKVHQGIIDMTRNQIETGAAPETVEKVLEVKVETEEAPKVGTETGVD